MLGVRSWLTPMHSTSSLATSFFFAEFSPMAVGMSGAPLRHDLDAEASRALAKRATGPLYSVIRAEAGTHLSAVAGGSAFAETTIRKQRRRATTRGRCPTPG